MFENADFLMILWYNMLDIRKSKYYNQKKGLYMSSNNSSAFYLDFKKKQKNEFEIPQLHTGAFAATSSNASKILNNAKKIIAENKSTSKPVAISRLTEGLVSLDNSSKVKLPDVDFTQENFSSKKADSFIKKNDNFEITPVREGTRIKNNIKSRLEHKYGSMDTKNLFDDIPDDIVEKNISTAKSAIDMNIKRGRLNFDYEKQFPNIVDGLSVYYAADEVGNSKEAKKAREAAYMKFDEPLVKDTGMRLLSAEIPNIAKENNRETPRNFQGVRFKAMAHNRSEHSADTTQKVEYPKSFYEEYISRREKINNDGQLPKIKSIGDIGKRFNKFSYKTTDGTTITPSENVIGFIKEYYSNEFNVAETTCDLILDNSQLESLHSYLTNGVKNAKKPANIGDGIWTKQVQSDLKWVDDMFGNSSKFAKILKCLPAITIAIDTSIGVRDNVKNKENTKEIISDAIIDIGFGTAEVLATGVAGSAIGGVPGAIAGILIGLAYSYFVDHQTYDKYDGKNFKQHIDSLF